MHALNCVSKSVRETVFSHRKSFIRFMSIGLPVHVKYNVSVDWMICACHVYQVSELGFLCMSLVSVSVNWGVCTCHLFKLVWIGLSVHATC